MIIMMIIIVLIAVGLAVFANWLIKLIEKDTNSNHRPRSVDDLKVLYALGKIDRTDFQSMKINFNKEAQILLLKEVTHE